MLFLEENDKLLQPLDSSVCNCTTQEYLSFLTFFFFFNVTVLSFFPRYYMRGNREWYRFTKLS